MNHRARLFPLSTLQLHDIRAEFVVRPPRVGEGSLKGSRSRQPSLVQVLLLIRRGRGAKPQINWIKASIMSPSS
ncbi:MAG TPA: hypothetical protein VGB05_07055, partial [Pyrinomonadaceae bacterium]